MTSRQRLARSDAGHIGRFRIHVDAGDVRAVTALDRSARAAIDMGSQEIPTLEMLLTESIQAEGAGADRVDVARDEDGRPRRIEIDYDTNTIDDEACYFIRRFAPPGVASTTSTEAEIYAAVIRLLMRDTTIGRAGSSLDVVDGPMKAAGKPRGDVFARPRTPFEGALVDEIQQSLGAQLSPLRLVGDVQVALRDDSGDGSVGNDAAILVLGEIERRGADKPRVPVTWWCDKCSRWLTYVLVEKDDRWVVTGTTDPNAGS